MEWCPQQGLVILQENLKHQNWFTKWVWAKAFCNGWRIPFYMGFVVGDPIAASRFLVQRWNRKPTERKDHEKQRVMVSDDSHYSGYSGLVTASWMMARYQWLSSFPTFEKIHWPGVFGEFALDEKDGKSNPKLSMAQDRKFTPTKKTRNNQKYTAPDILLDPPANKHQETMTTPPPLTRLSPTFHPKWRRLIDCWPAWPSSLQRPSPLRSYKCARSCHPCWYGAHHSWAAPGRRYLERSPRHWRRKPWFRCGFWCCAKLAVEKVAGRKMGKIWFIHVWNLQGWGLTMSTSQILNTKMLT